MPVVLVVLHGVSRVVAVAALIAALIALLIALLIAALIVRSSREMLAESVASCG